MIRVENTSGNFSSGIKPPNHHGRGHGWWRCSVGLFIMSSSSKQKSGDLEVTRVKDMFVTNKRSQFFTSEEAICGTLLQMICQKQKAYTCARETQDNFTLDITTYKNPIKSSKISKNSHELVEKNEGNTLVSYPSLPLISAHGQCWKQHTGLDGSPVWASTATLMYDELTLRGLFSEFHAANDCRNDALADCMRTDCNSWLFTGSAAVQHRGGDFCFPPRNTAVQPLPQVGVTRVTPVNFPKATTVLSWSSAKGTVDLSVPCCPFIWCWSIHHPLY